MIFRVAVVLAILSVACGFTGLAPRVRMTTSSAMKMQASSPGETSSDMSSIIAKPNLSKYAAAAVAVTGIMMPAMKVFADEAPAAPAAAAPAPAPAPPVEKKELGPPPTDFGMDFKDFYADCTKLVGHMRYAVQMEKGNPNLAQVAQKTKDEMLSFVSYYRRFNGINGRQSFSLLYTSINVLAGHYTSYGVKFPVPEKRRKRLLQEFNDIEKNIRKKR